jgi:hypothetical protein
MLYSDRELRSVTGCRREYLGTYTMRETQNTRQESLHRQLTLQTNQTTEPVKFGSWQSFELQCGPNNQNKTHWDKVIREDTTKGMYP